MSRRSRVAVALLAIMLGLTLGANLDAHALPFSRTERLQAVFLLDGQAYFGHLEDLFWNDTLTLRDVYYFADARNTTTNLAVGLVRRGSEVHQPADGMQIRRDKVLAIERVGPDSTVAKAIAAARAIEAAK